MVKVENYTFSSLVHNLASKIGPVNHLSIGFPFAKCLRNFCGKKRKIFLSLSISFVQKNNNLRNLSQKSFYAKLPYSAFAKLKFWEIPQFRKNQMVGDGVCF